MKKLLYALMLGISAHLMGQDVLQEIKLSEGQALEDYDQYVELLKETHPGLYRYTDTQTMLHRIDSLRETLSDSIPFYTFYKKIAWLNASIRCSHSYVIPKVDFNSFLMREAKSIPFYIMPVDGKFYVLFNGSEDTSIKPGFEVTSINGRPITNIAEEIGNHFWVDGEIELAKNSVLQGNLFRAYYYSFIDSSEILDFELIDRDGKKIEKRLASVSALTAMRNYKKNPVNKGVYDLYKTKPPKWSLKILKDTPSTAVLTIPGFGGKKVKSEEKAAEFMTKFMDKVMTRLEKNQITNLIVELRYNRGGWDIMGTTLMSYLMKKETPMPYYGPSYAITNDSKFLAYSDLSGYDKAQLDKELEPQADGTFKLRAEYNATFAPVKKRENAFKGNLFILMDEYTSSAAAELCAIAKSNGLATLIGQETNGTYGGFNSSAFIKLPLKNSEIVVNTPLVRNHLAVDGSLQPLERGVLPDHSVGFSLEDVLLRKDVQMEFVKELIRSGTDKPY